MLAKTTRQCARSSSYSPLVRRGCYFGGGRATLVAPVRLTPDDFRSEALQDLFNRTMDARRKIESQRTTSLQIFFEKAKEAIVDMYNKEIDAISTAAKEMENDDDEEEEEFVNEPKNKK
jgi:hypothetical protein